MIHVFPLTMALGFGTTELPSHNVHNADAAMVVTFVPRRQNRSTRAEGTVVTVLFIVGTVLDLFIQQSFIMVAGTAFFFLANDSNSKFQSHQGLDLVHKMKNDLKKIQMDTNETYTYKTHWSLLLQLHHKVTQSLITNHFTTQKTL